MVCAIVLVICLAKPVASAQEHPNFAGTWNLNIDKSEFGGLPKPDSLTYVLHHAGANLAVDITQDGKKAHLEFTTDGEERMTESNAEYEIWARVYWAGPVLVFESRQKARPAHESPGLRWTSRWSLSDDGRTLAVQKHFTAPQGEFEQKLIYDRQ